MSESSDGREPYEYSTMIDMKESAKLYSQTVEETARGLINARDSQTPVPFDFKGEEWKMDGPVYVQYLEFRDSHGHAVSETSPNIETCYIVLVDAPPDTTSS